MSKLQRVSSIILLVFGVMLTTNTSAEPFLDLGIATTLDVNESMGRNCIRDWDKDRKEWGCSANPLGYIAVGYQYNGFIVSLEHWSSLAHYDAGLNMVSLKYRIK